MGRDRSGPREERWGMLLKTRRFANQARGCRMGLCALAWIGAVAGCAGKSEDKNDEPEPPTTPKPPVPPTGPTGGVSRARRQLAIRPQP